ncbi:restriction endonuclease subunit S [Neisseria sp. P0021.S005]|jgi:restriction modification system DNA specificity domain protein|uniref:restriction endonuclease subunit S n=2 Tax=unclassified Neisseria TaxID=2623750 RepID=UPI0035FA7F4F
MDKQQEPRLRFKGFTGAWEEKVLGEILNVRNEFVDSSLYDLDVELENLISNSGILVGDTSVRTQTTSLFRKGDILFGRLRPYLNKWWFAEKDGVKSGEIWALETSSEYSNFFAYLLVQSRKFLETANITSGTKMPRADWRSLTAITFNFPSKPEQTHLGLFFRRLDSQIAESRAVLEKSRQLKKAMLAKMFPANGEKIPKIRFKGFEGEWECRKLGIEVEIIGGGTPDTTNSAYWNGDIDWYSPTEIGEAAYANGSVKKITLLGLQKSSAQILPANRTVLFTSRASIGDMAILTKDGATNQGFQSFVVREKLDVYFLYTMGFKIKDYALKNASGSTFLEISKNTLSQMEFFVPSLKEQTQIGNFFRQLDETIALQSAEVEKLNQLKKGLLAAMLV